MTRIAILKTDDMNDEQRAVIEASKANGKPYGGPFWAYIRNPKLMQCVQNTADCIADSTLSPREQQIATLTVARFWNANYPWAAQSRNGLKVGLTQQEIDAINARAALPSSSKRELLAHEIANELLADKRLSAATYAAAEACFSTEELVALVARVGAFSMTCCTANAFDITPGDDAPDRLKA
ncbi:MAG: carboxymuconolactone decarboxylase family protein [Deltaproteobacteria bacterium]|nr:carboxymuconolactone decarboxylase family protein [Deltaproteobacteria bacterium]